MNYHLTITWLKVAILSTSMCLGLSNPIIAQVAVDVGHHGVGIEVGQTQPACQYGYYEYSPYNCVEQGYYGTGYFHNGIFLGVGPWTNYGYSHGWGRQRFHDRGDGQYRREEQRGHGEYRNENRRK